MKKKKGKLDYKIAILGLICAIPISIRAFNESGGSLILKIIYGPLIVFGLFLTTGIAAIALSFVFHYAAVFFRWINNEKEDETKEPYWDVEIYMYALIPVAFAVGYYYVLSGNNFI